MRDKMYIVIKILLFKKISIKGLRVILFIWVFCFIEMIRGLGLIMCIYWRVWIKVNFCYFLIFMNEYLLIGK